MTTIICSLFLPYTIDFDSTNTPSSTDGALSPADLVSPPPRVASLSQEPSKPLSLFTKAATPPATPSYSSDVDPFAKALGAATKDDTPQRPSRPANPRQLTLARTETNQPQWGKSKVYHQPKPKVQDVPASTILNYARIQEENAQKALKGLARSRGRQNIQTNARTRSKSRGRYDTAAWRVQPAVQGNGALTNAIKAASENGTLEQVTWVGTLGFPTDQLSADRRIEIEQTLESENDALPVWCKDKDFDGHYTHYAHTILWPVFHYQIPDHPKSKAFEDHSWKYYVKVNEAFAERVVKSYKTGDTIWIHDYHLFLLPELIRKKIPDARIGFFLHAAFPSSEVFRCLAVRKQLLEGVLGANLIVFQAPEYAHHFLTTCSRILVVEATEEGVQLEDRFINVTSVPMGVNPDQLQAARGTPGVKEWVDSLTEKYKDKKIIVARDKVDNIRGVRQKLLAYELFLKDNPDWVDKVVLIQVATSTDIDKDVEMAIADVVTRIDSRFSSLAHQPLVFLKQDIAFEQYIALLSVADALMLTPLRDGMNLTGHEFVICQDGKLTEASDASNKKHAPMIISEFTGSATVFEGAHLAVNPWDIRQCSRAIKQALAMGREERDQRYDIALEAVLQKNAERWVEQLRSRLVTAYNGYKHRGIMNVPRLSFNSLLNQYKNSENRLFILDYEGTLAAWDRPNQASVSSPQRMIDTMVNLLAASDKNIVYVTSGRAPNELENIFRMVPGIGLIAENGCFVRPFTTEFQAEDWITLANEEECANWKPGVVNIFKYYEERLEGAWIEERLCSVRFHYGNVAASGNVDPESVHRQAGECANHINDSGNASRVKAVPVDNRMILVELMDHNKMTAAAWVLRWETKRISGIAMTPGHRDSAVGLNNSPLELRLASPNPDDGTYSPTSPPGAPVNMRESSYFEGRPAATSADLPVPSTSIASQLEAPTSDTTMPDFLMVCGDSRSDEIMFKWANMLAAEKYIKEVVSLYVGSGNATEATATLSQGVTGLLTTLQKLASL